MKTLKYLFSAFIVLAALQLTSCGGNNPAAKYIDIMNKIVDKMEKCQNMEELNQLIADPTLRDEASTLVKDNQDYVLTDSDKENLIKVNDRMMRVMLEKSTELSGLPEEFKKGAEAQLQASMEELHNYIEGCKTLGDLDAL